MSHTDYPITPAIRLLRDQRIEFTPQLYPYEEHGGTRHSAQCLNIPEHAVIKTLVMENERRQPLMVLMHGDYEVSTKQLARLLGVKQITPCAPDVASKHTGYLVGGTSPLGTRKVLPVYIEQTILKLPRIYINGGKRGFLVALNPRDLERALTLTPVTVGYQPNVGER